MDKKFYIEKSKAIIMEIFRGVQNTAKSFFEKYGYMGIVSVLLVTGKFTFFYEKMSVKSNGAAVLAVSLILTYFLFKGFRNKLIPASIYTVISFLMLADVTYCSFFNKYLSVGMMGNASMLGDITASIKEVFSPVSLFIFADVIAIFITIIYFDLYLKNKNQSHIEQEPKESVLKIIEIEKIEGEERDILAELDAMSEEVTAETEESENLRKQREPVISVEEGKEAEIEYTSTVGSRIARRKKKRKANLKKMMALRNGLIPVCLVLALLVTGGVSPFFQTISKQEFYTYHIGDMVTKTFGISPKPQIEPFTDHYEQEKEGPYFGIAEGRNLVVIQIESFQDFVINYEYNGQEVTPFLNSLIKNDSTYFDNYYQQVGTGNTSDAEFESNNSYMGSIEAFTYQIYEKNKFRGLPWLLKDKGYYSAVLHAHENRAFWNRDDIYPALGFDDYYGGLIGDTERPNGNFEMTEWMGWGLTDTEFYPQAMDYIKDFKEPFYSFIITLSNHHPYEMLDKYTFIDLKEEDKNTVVGNYINSVAYTDYAIEQLFDLFKKNGLYDNTIFALYGDHMGLSSEEDINKSMKKILGREYEWDDRMNIPFIIHVPGADESFTQVIHNAGGQIDFMPTISYLMGFEHLDTVYLGHNMYNYDKNIVAEHAYLPYGSFFTNDYGFEMSRDGVFENGRVWDLKTHKTITNMDKKKLYSDYMASRRESDTSIYILKNDLFRKIYEENAKREDVLK